MDAAAPSQPGTGPRAESARAPRPAGHRPTVLVAEDDYTLRWMLCDILQIGGYETREGADGMAALDEAARHAGPIDLLVTDIVMPRLNGIQLAERLRETRAGMQVLFITGHAIDGVPPGSAVLRKPFRPKELLEAVEGLLAAGAGRARPGCRP